MPTKTKTLRFEYWKSNKNKQWYWRIRAGNGEPIAQGEGYKSKAGALKLFRLLLSLPLVAVDVSLGEAGIKLALDQNPIRYGKKPKGYSGPCNRSWP